MNVWDKYLAQLDEEKKNLVLNILGIAKKYSPDAVEEMPYGVPGFKLNNKPLIAVAAHKNHFGVYPFSPAVIEAAKPLLKGLETAEGTIRFKYDQYPSGEIIKLLIEQRTAEIELD